MPCRLSVDKIRFSNWRKQSEGLQRFVNLSYMIQITKDLEPENMKLLMRSQVQLGKLKRLKTNSEPDDSVQEASLQGTQADNDPDYPARTGQAMHTPRIQLST